MTKSYMMFGKLIVTLTLLGFATPLFAHALTKEIKPEEALSKNTALGEFVVKQIFENPETTLASLAELLTKSSDPQVSEILDIFNRNFQSEMLITKGDYIEIDPSAFKKFVTTKAQLALKVILPNDPLQQMALLIAFQAPLENSLKNLPAQIEETKVSVADIQSLISARTRSVATVDTRSLVDDILRTTQTNICNAYVRTILNQTGSVLDDLTSNLFNITGILVTDIVTNLVSAGESLTSDLLEYTRSLNSEYCVDSSLPRKRRDIEDTEIVALDRSKRFLDVAFFNILLGIFDILFGLVAGLLNNWARSLAYWFVIDVVQATIDSFLQDQVLAILYTIIDSILVVS